MKKITAEVKIAIVAILALVVLFFGLQFLKGLDLFSKSNTYNMTFDNVNGLGVQAAIYSNGYKVGHVSAIEYDYSTGAIRVSAELDRNLQVPMGTTADIEKDMMGNMQVNLHLGDIKSGIMKPNGTIEGRVNTGALGKAAEMIPAIEEMLPKLDAILTSLQALVEDPAIASSLHNVQAITGNLKTTTNEINQLVATLNLSVPELAGKAGVVLDNTNTVLGNANTVILSADNVMDNLAKIDVNGTMQMVNRSLEGANQTMSKINESLTEVDKLTVSLNNGEGSLGLLMKDPQLYNNLSATMGSADSLLIDLRQHPKRYVHFSIFGRKDK